MKKHKVPFRYIGAKSYIAPWIIEHLPSHHCYIEVFGGTGAVMFQKGTSSYEVFNDLDSEVYSFFKALREESDEFIRYLKLCPASRELLHTWSNENETGLSVIERGARFFVRTMLSFSGTQSVSFPVRNGYRKDGAIRSVGFAEMIKNKVDQLYIFAERLRRVTIENLHFKDLISKYDWEGVCFYCDPEYIDRGLYRTGMSWQDHCKLAELLNNAKGKVIISYYPDPKLDELYPTSDWVYVEKVVARHSVKQVKQDKAIELLIMNYNPKKDKFAGQNQTLERFV